MTIAVPFYLIVHSDHRLRPAGPNAGAETATICQAKFLARAGRRVVVAACLEGGEEERDGVTYWNLGPEYDVERALDRAARIGCYHLIAAGRAHSLFFARRRPECLSRTLITHDRGAGDGGVKPEVLEHLVDRILCVSHAQREKLISEGAPGGKMIVIHNGVDLDIFPASPPERHDPMTLVFSGALVYDKGLHFLLGSFADLKSKYPRLRLEVFGSASLWSREEYINVEDVQRALPDVVFHGRAPQAAIAEGFGRAGLCVIPSPWFDPYPLTSLEAQVCGCPVAAFNMGGLPEGIVPGKTGIIIDEVNQSALTRALDSLLSNPVLLAEMSRNCLDISRKAFRWEVIAERLIALCEGAPAPGSDSAAFEARMRELADAGMHDEADRLIRERSRGSR